MSVLHFGRGHCARCEIDAHPVCLPLELRAGTSSSCQRSQLMPSGGQGTPIRFGKPGRGVPRICTLAIPMCICILFTMQEAQGAQEAGKLVSYLLLCLETSGSYLVWPHSRNLMGGLEPWILLESMACLLCQRRYTFILLCSARECNLPLSPGYFDKNGTR